MSVIRGPVKGGSKLISVNIRLGSSYIRSVRWFGENLFVLNSKNEIYTFERNEYNMPPSVTSFVAVTDDIIDFLPLAWTGKSSEILTVSGNGFVRINQDIMTNVEIEGELVLSRIDTDSFVIANNKVSLFMNSYGYKCFNFWYCQMCLWGLII